MHDLQIIIDTCNVPKLPYSLLLGNNMIGYNDFSDYIDQNYQRSLSFGSF